METTNKTTNDGSSFQIALCRGLCTAAFLIAAIAVFIKGTEDGAANYVLGVLYVLLALFPFSPGFMRMTNKWARHLLTGLGILMIVTAVWLLIEVR